MGKLVQISFTKYLKDSAFVTMCDDLVEIFNDAEHSIECEIYEEALERYKMEVSIMHAIMPRERAHVLTHEINEVNILRRDAVKGLVYAAKAASVSTDMKKRKAARTFMTWFSKYRHNLVNGSQDVVSRTIVQISEDMTKDASLGSAIVTIGISGQMSELIAINPEVKTLRHERALDRSNRKRSYVDNTTIRKDVTKVLGVLLDQVERLIEWNGREIADHLELALLDVMDRTRAIVKRQKTKNANKRANASNGAKPMPSSSTPLHQQNGEDGGNNDEATNTEEKEAQNSSSNENTPPNNSSNPTSPEEKDENESSEAV
ncbi:MAG: hypothetical protein GXZ03_09880 [Proteiniphilum sp.]|nr:hypothetical protein [Proteiniphilum sp.]